MIYMDSNFYAPPFVVQNASSIWEGLFIKIRDSAHSISNIVIGNIYPPPYDNTKGNIETFVSEHDPVLSMISSHSKDVIITGDYNINLLHIDLCNEEHYGEFLDLMLGHSLYPQITLPTRLVL